jgi:hypothetical protein
VLGEVLSKGHAVGQPTLRSWLLDDPNAVFSPGKEAEGKKEKRKEPAKGKKLLTAPTLLSRWEKRGRGGTEDETVKPLDGV